MSKFATMQLETQRRTMEEDFLPILHFGFSASPQIFFPNATLETNELYLNEVKLLLSREEARTAINPRHTLSVAKLKQLNLPVKIPDIKPYTRIGPGGSIIVMQPVGASPALLDGFFNDWDIRNLKVIFRWIRVVRKTERTSFLQKPPFN